MVFATALASIVLPVPGKSSSSRWPSATRQVEGQPHLVRLAEHGDGDVVDHRLEDLAEARHVVLGMHHGRLDAVLPHGHALMLVVTTARPPGH